MHKSSPSPSTRIALRDLATLAAFLALTFGGVEVSADVYDAEICERAVAEYHKSVATAERYRSIKQFESPG